MPGVAEEIWYHCSLLNAYRLDGAAFRHDEILMDTFDVESLKGAVNIGWRPEFLFFLGA